MTTSELIDRLIRIKDGLTHRADRDAINAACERLKSAPALAAALLTAEEARAELEAAVLAECEACASVADDCTPGKFAAPLVAHVVGASIAAAIRARSET